MDSRDAIKLVMGVVATVAALVLGLMIASAKSLFDTQKADFRHASAEIIRIDRLLARHGPETNGIRDDLRRAAADRLH